MALLLTELVDNVNVIEESKDSGEKQLFIEGIFMQTERKNQNGRIYPQEVMTKEVNRYINEVVKKNRALGELEHPKTPSINLDRVSHRITDLRMEGNDVYGRALVLDTPTGNVIKGLVKGGAVVGVSSRALGSVEKSESAMIVQEDFRLITVDCVADPSAHDAFVSGLYESADWVWEHGEWVQKMLEEGKKNLDSKYTTEKALELFEKFVRNL